VLRFSTLSEPMDFFLSLGGSKAGPYTIFKVGELLESGAANPDTLAWHRGLDGWKPIRDVPALEAVLQQVETPSSGAQSAPPAPPASPSRLPLPPEPLPGTPLPQVGPAPAQVLTRAAVEPSRPFVRFWARMFDFTLVSVIVFQFSDFAFPQPQAGENLGQFYTRYFEEMGSPGIVVFARTLFFAQIGWNLLEAVLIHLFGATPGKLLFGLKVRPAEGGRIAFLPSLGRAFYVYVLGVGFYQFPFILIGMIFSFFRLTTTGLCYWDQHLKTRVEHAPLGVVRIMLAIFAFFVLLTLQSVKFS
jgi:hypothetical protein